MIEGETKPRLGTAWMNTWPNNICGGFIQYAKSQPMPGLQEAHGYYFYDASHGLPVLGHVEATTTGNYPDEAEMIARRLCACWNACVGLSIEEVEAQANGNALAVREDMQAEAEGRCE